MPLALQVLRILGAERHPAGACTPALLATCSSLEMRDQPVSCCSALDSISCDAGTIATLHVAREAWADDGQYGVMCCRALAGPAVRASSQQCMQARSAARGGACGMSPTTWVRSCTDSCTRPLAACWRSAPSGSMPDTHCVGGLLPDAMQPPVYGRHCLASLAILVADKPPGCATCRWLHRANHRRWAACRVHGPAHVTQLQYCAH